MAKVKISELPSLSPATLDTTFVVGISGSTTYKISINQLTSSLDTTFATDLVTAALSSSLDGKLSTSSYSTDSASFNSRIISGSAVAGTISGSAQISALGFVTGAYTTINSFNSLTQSFNSISQSFSVISGSFDSIDFSGINAVTESYLLFTQSYYSASASFDSRVDSLEFKDTTLATTSSLEIVSASVWGAFQSASSYSSSLQTAISASDAEYTSFSASLQTSISSSNYNITINSASVSSLSSSVDSRLDILEASASSDYINVKYSSFEPFVPQVNSAYKFDATPQGNIVYDNTTGYFTLIAGKIYSLNASVGLRYGYEIVYQWYDATNNQYLGVQGGTFDANGGHSSENHSPLANAIVIPSTNINVYLRSTSIAHSNPKLKESETFAEIKQIGKSEVVNNIYQYVSSSTYTTDSSSFNSRIISGSAVAGTISGSSQISTLGFITGSYISSSTYTTDSASFDSRINSIVTESGSNLTYFIEAYANVTYTLPGGFTEDPCRYSVVSATENVPSNWFNTSTYIFTPQKAGYWEINAAYDVYRNGEASMAIRKNGSIVTSAGSFNAVAQDISKIIYLNGSTDYIDIVNTGGAALQRNQYQQRSWFQAKFVGNISGSTDLPAGVISGSSQLPTGLISSSTQLPSNLVSGSSQISTLGFITGSYISSSTYTTDSSSFNSRIISGSAVAGTISSSAQISTLGFVSSSNLSSIRTITSASYAALTPVSGTLYIIIG